MTVPVARVLESVTGGGVAITVDVVVTVVVALAATVVAGTVVVITEVMVVKEFGITEYTILRGQSIKSEWYVSE